VQVGSKTRPFHCSPRLVYLLTLRLPDPAYHPVACRNATLRARLRLHGWHRFSQSRWGTYIFPYSCTGPWPQLPCASAAWAMDLENQNSRQRRRNSKFIAGASSTHRVLQLWSNRTWSTWMLFWSRKWPSEASNHHFDLLGEFTEKLNGD